MLISCGSCEKPPHPGNYNASEICRSIAWSSAMIFGCQIFLSCSHSYSHCRLLDHYFGCWNGEVLSSSSTGCSHCPASIRRWCPGRDDLCCLFSHVVTQANYKHCNYKQNALFHPVFWPPKFTLLLTSFEITKYQCRHALFNNNSFPLV